MMMRCGPPPAVSAADAGDVDAKPEMLHCDEEHHEEDDCKRAVSLGHTPRPSRHAADPPIGIRRTMLKAVNSPVLAIWHIASSVLTAT